MNGTSMSSPSCAGCVALIISGLKQEGIHYTPSSIKLALQNTAKKITGLDSLMQGNGMVQTLDCYEYLLSNKNDVVCYNVFSIFHLFLVYVIG
jgi:tripeptidyl-peptidase-2